MVDLKVSYDTSDVLTEFDDLEDKLNHLPLDEIGTLMINDVRSHDIPWRTGALYESIESQIVGNEVDVQSPLDYAVFVDQGTYKMEARPFMFLDDYVEDEIENLIWQHIGE